jgi:hypothetical protein
VCQQNTKDDGSLQKTQEKHQKKILGAEASVPLIKHLNPLYCTSLQSPPCRSVRSTSVALTPFGRQYRRRNPYDSIDQSKQNVIDIANDLSEDNRWFAMGILNIFHSMRPILDPVDSIIDPLLIVREQTQSCTPFGRNRSLAKMGSTQSTRDGRNSCTFASQQGRTFDTESKAIRVSQPSINRHSSDRFK